MVVERLPMVILPSGRVPGRVLLVLPIWEAAAAAEQRWDREKSSCSEGFGGPSKYMPKGGTGRASGGPGAPPARSRGGRPQGAWSPCGPPRLPFGRSVVSVSLIFYIIFLDFSGQFSKRENLKYKNSRKQKLALGCTGLVRDRKSVV